MFTQLQTFYGRLKIFRDIFQILIIFAMLSRMSFVGRNTSQLYSKKVIQNIYTEEHMNLNLKSKGHFQICRNVPQIGKIHILVVEEQIFLRTPNKIAFNPLQAQECYFVIPRFFESDLFSGYACILYEKGFFSQQVPISLIPLQHHIGYLYLPVETYMFLFLPIELLLLGCFVLLPIQQMFIYNYMEKCDLFLFSLLYMGATYHQVGPETENIIYGD